jgi:hypothetical protein
MKKLIVAVAALALMAGSAYAAEWDFYGSARIYTGWASDDNSKAFADDDWHYGEFLSGTSRVGANVKVSDELTANFEYGASDGKANIRHLYGKWNFGGGYLLVGHTTTPVAIGYSNQIVYNSDLADNGLSGFGNCDTGRSAQIQLGFGGFKIAFMNTDSSDTVGVTASQKVIPQIAASYTLGFDMGEFVVGGIYNTYESGDNDIDSYVLGVGTNLNFGAANVFATAVYGQNIGIIVDNYTQADFGGGQPELDATGDVNDNDSLGFTIGAGFTVNEMFALEAGYGYIQDDLDGAADKNKAQSYYIQSTITLAPGVTIVPELGFIDLKEDTEADITYLAAKWQINF